MRLAFYLTHPEVTIDPDRPVPDWGLSEIGRRGTRSLAKLDWLRAVDAQARIVKAVRGALDERPEACR